MKRILFWFAFCDMNFKIETNNDLSFDVKYGRGRCAMVTMQSVIKYKKNKFANYKELRSNIFHKSGYMFPISIKNILWKYGIKTQIWICNKKDKKEKIDFLKSKIENWPLILLIWHTFKKWSNFSYLYALSQHYISVWWFDDNRKVFYIHNSKPHKNFLNNSLDVWNMEISYDTLIKAWSFSYLGLKRNLYIEIV